MIILVWKTGKAQLGSYLLIFVIDCLLFPYCFYMEGGSQGGVSMWYILSFFAVFLLIRGKGFWPMLLLSFASMMATYILAYFNPDWVTPLESKWVVYADFMFSILIIGAISGIIVRFQNQVYLGEQKKYWIRTRNWSAYRKQRTDFSLT